MAAGGGPGPASYAHVQSFLGSWLGMLLLIGWAYALFFHLCNGIRHLVWDIGHGFDLATTYATGWIVVAASAGLTLIAVDAGMCNGSMVSPPVEQGDEHEGMRSPLGRAIGLGSAKEGVEHWWPQRLTAVALVPLGLWFVASLLAHVGGDYDQTVAWLGQPIPAILMIVLISTSFYHAALGAAGRRRGLCPSRVGQARRARSHRRFACVLLAVAGVFAVLRVAVRG